MEDTARKKSYINWILMAVNALVFLYLEAAGSSEDAYFMYTKGAMLKAAVIEDGEYYRLLTAMFMHFGISHLVNNMIVLFALGDNLERALGHVKYLILYLFSHSFRPLRSPVALQAPVGIRLPADLQDLYLLGAVSQPHHIL